MKAYKYRSLHNFKYVADILCHGHFYAARFQDLNDPMEGYFDSKKGTERELLEKIEVEKCNQRICSFSKDFRNILLWAHYADNFRGICIEVELIEWPDQVIASVRYDPFKPIFDNTLEPYTYSWMDYIFRGKDRVWKYEKEIRVLTKNKIIQSPSVKVISIFLGVRTPPAIRDAILRIVPEGISVWETKISEKSNRVIKVCKVKKGE